MSTLARTIAMSERLAPSYLNLGLNESGCRAKRRLFRDDDDDRDHGANQRLLEEQLSSMNKESSRKYGYDFANDRPFGPLLHRQPFNWKRPDAATASATGIEWIGERQPATPAPAPSIVAQQPAEITVGESESGKSTSRQTKMSDYFSRRKRLPEENIRSKKKMRAGASGSGPESSASASSSSSS